MKILAIIQARTSSTRLPGKVLKKILGKTLLELQIERTLRSKYIDKLIVATSLSEDDREIEKICKKINIDCFRGSLNNVIDRFYQAAKKYSPEHVVRLTGDCPLSDPGVIDDVIDFYFSGNFDYATNAVIPIFPDGLDVEIFSFKVLGEAWTNAELPSHIEHVTPYMRQEYKFKVGNYTGNFDYSNLRWTVDEPEDYEFVRNIFEALYLVNSLFSWKDVLTYLKKHQDLMNINSNFERNEGLHKSCIKDKIFLPGKNLNK